MDADQAFRALRFCQTAFTGLMGGAAMYISLIEHPARMSIQDTESAHKQFSSSFDLAARYMAIGSIFPMGGGLLAYYINPKEGLPCAIVAGLYFVNVPYSFLFLIPNYVKPIQVYCSCCNTHILTKQPQDFSPAHIAISRKVVRCMAKVNGRTAIARLKVAIGFALS
ncbi:hypothetical protein AC249_AIPGENE19745 [Exaiptasia diaphana]|nr:hypothetical protein AC249_AIPGENE19745 [Exaiptasia diaphana]